MIACAAAPLMVACVPGASAGAAGAVPPTEVCWQERVPTLRVALVDLRSAPPFLLDRQLAALSSAHHADVAVLLGEWPNEARARATGHFVRVPARLGELVTSTPPHEVVEQGDLCGASMTRFEIEIDRRSESVCFGVAVASVASGIEVRRALECVGRSSFGMGLVIATAADAGSDVEVPSGWTCPLLPSMEHGGDAAGSMIADCRGVFASPSLGDYVTTPFADLREHLFGLEVNVGPDAPACRRTESR